MADRKFGGNVVNNMGSVEELWQAFFANPTEWWDNRKNKVVVQQSHLNSEDHCIMSDVVVL